MIYACISCITAYGLRVVTTYESVTMHGCFYVESNGLVWHRASSFVHVPGLNVESIGNAVPRQNERSFAGW